MSPEKMIGFSFAAAAAKGYEVFLSAMRRFVHSAKRRIFAHTDKKLWKTAWVLRAARVS